MLSVVAAGRTVSATRAFFLGLTTGLLYFAGTLYWVVETMRLHGGLSLPVSVPIAVLLVGYLALYPGWFAVLLAAVVRRAGLPGLWLAPLLWVATEWLRATLGPGFPWVQLGASQATVLPVVQLASVAGVYGLSALLALVATAAVVVTVGRTPGMRRGVLGVVALVVVLVSWGAVRVADGRLLVAGQPLRVGLVQGAIPQDQKWDPRFSQDIVSRYLGLSRDVIERGADLVIWPEASTPFVREGRGARRWHHRRCP